MQVDVRSTYTLCSPAWYRIATQNIVIATVVTENERRVQGVGAHLFSEDKAAERAIENAKDLAAETDVGFKIDRVSVPSQRTSYSFIETQGVVRSEHMPSFGGRPTVEVTVTDGEGQVDGKGKQGFLSTLFSFSFGGNFTDATRNAVESASKKLQRTGTTTVER